MERHLMVETAQVLGGAHDLVRTTLSSDPMRPSAVAMGVADLAAAAAALSQAATQLGRIVSRMVEIDGLCDDSDSGVGVRLDIAAAALDGAAPLLGSVSDCFDTAHQELSHLGIR